MTMQQREQLNTLLNKAQSDISLLKEVWPGKKVQPNEETLIALGDLVIFLATIIQNDEAQSSSG